jgi:hypothetical protein
VPFLDALTEEGAASWGWSATMNLPRAWVEKAAYSPETLTSFRATHFSFFAVTSIRLTHMSNASA